MRAVLLVGGEGTRLRPLTYTTPKPLLPIANRPFLERQLTWLASHGVDDVVLAMGYLPEAFEERFSDGRFEGVGLRYAVEPEPLGTAGAIRFAAAGTSERFVVCNGDVLTTLDLGALVRFHEQRDAEATIHLTRVEDPSAFGVVPTAADGEVQRFVEKPPPGEAPTDWVNAGTYVLEPAVLDEIPEVVPTSIERDVFPRMLERPGRVFAVESAAYWRDIGTPASYLAAHAEVLAGLVGAPPVPGAVEDAPQVWVEGSADLDGAVLGPPVLVGSGARVAAGARGEASTLGTGCALEADVTVTRSVVLAGARVGAGSQITDSVVGPGAVLEPGVVLADESLVGAGAVVAAGARMSSARVHVPPRP